MFTKYYKEIKELQPFSIRGVMREMALSGLSFTTKISSLDHYLKQPRVQFLYLHHVFEDELEKFELLIQKLLVHHTFIPYGKAVDIILKNEIDKPYISISSDDGFKNNLGAVKILDKYGVKGCFFVNPDTIGLKDYGEIEKFCKTKLNFPPTEFMDWNDIDKLLKNGHEIGSHTMGHINIANTDFRIIEENLQTSYDIIESKCGEVNHFAYPYGRFHDFNSEVFDLTHKIGYKSCATAERGCHTTDSIIDSKKLLIRRDHVVCDWNLNHIMYFIISNSRKLDIKNNFIPY
jgi:peptidoglycan/xylan/chitin deacetylase (PgdA/CDA1 family)